MLQLLSTILAAGRAIGAANALPADIRSATSSVDTSCTTATSTGSTDLSMSIFDVPSFTLRPKPNATTTAMVTTIQTHFPPLPTVLDTSYTLRSDTDSVTFTTSTIPATNTIEKRAVCTGSGIIHECDTAPPADGSTTTYTPPLPSDFAAPVCADTSNDSGSPQIYLMQAVDQVCQNANWNIMVGPSDTLRWTVKALDDKDMTFSIDFDWLAVSADKDSVLFSTVACHEGFSKLVSGCKSDSEPLMTGGHIEGKFSGVPVTFFVSVDLA